MREPEVTRLMSWERTRVLRIRKFEDMANMANMEEKRFPQRGWWQEVGGHPGEGGSMDPDGGKTGSPAGKADNKSWLGLLAIRWILNLQTWESGKIRNNQRGTKPSKGQVSGPSLDTFLHSGGKPPPSLSFVGYPIKDYSFRICRIHGATSV